MTIVEAIKQVMRDTGRPMTVDEVYRDIIEQGLYTFNADQPVQIVRNQIRRHCQGIDVPSASHTKHFVLHNDGTYTALSRPNKRLIRQLMAHLLYHRNVQQGRPGRRQTGRRPSSRSTAGASPTS